MIEVVSKCNEKTTGARKDNEHGPDDAAGKDEVYAGDTIVVFHFHQGSTPWRLQELLPLGSGGENSR
jgi:hypothetical protein